MTSSDFPRQRLMPGDQVREARPFYWIVMLVLLALYVLALSQSTALRDPVRLVLFTVLMLAHAALHWNSPRVAGRLRAGMVFLIAQAALVFLLPLVAQAEYLVLGLSLALIGEAVGILWNVRWAVAAILILVGLAVLDLVLLSPDHSVPGWTLTAVPMIAFVITYVVLYVRQAEARAHAQKLLEELEIAHHQLSDYAARVEDLTLVNERQRMARELHDTLAQGLAGLILQLEAANSHLASGRTDRVQNILQQAMTRARGTLADARRAIDDLRAGQDFEGALREQVAQFTETTGTHCVLDVSVGTELPEGVKQYALRTIAEGLTNISRHSQAQHAWVSARTTDRDLVLELRDDGRGFDPQRVPAGHYGLLGMRERARVACGTLEITSAPGKGTTLRLQLPLRAPPP